MKIWCFVFRNLATNIQSSARVKGWRLGGVGIQVLESSLSCNDVVCKCSNSTYFDFVTWMYFRMRWKIFFRSLSWSAENLDHLKFLGPGLLLTNPRSGMETDWCTSMMMASREASVACQSRPFFGTKNRGFYPPNHPFVHRVWNHDFHHPFWGEKPPYFWVDTHSVTLTSFCMTAHDSKVLHPYVGQGKQC